MPGNDVSQILTLITKLDASGLKHLQSELDSSASKAESSGSRIGGALSGIGKIAAGIAVADIGSKLAGGLSDAVKAASEFDDSMMKTQALAGASASEMDGYRKGILDLTTQIPVSAKELSDALFFVKSAGFSGADALNILKISGEAAAAGLGETKDIAGTVTSVLTDYKMSAQDAAKVTDILTAAVTDGKASAADFAPALARVLPIASAMGVSFEEVSASIATMTRAGLTADEASTALRGALTNLEKPGKAAQTALASIGLTAEDVKKSIRDKGLLSTLQELMDKTGGNIDTLDHIIPNVRALTGVLASAGLQGESYAKTLDDMNHAQGKTEDAFKKTSETASFQMGLMKNDLQKIMIEIGGKILPMITPILQNITSTLPKIFDSISDLISHPEHILTAIPQFLSTIWNGLLTGLGTLSEFASKLGGWFLGQMGKAFIFLKTANWGQAGNFIRDGLLAGLGAISNLTQRIGGWFADEIGKAFTFLASVDWGSTASNIGKGLLSAIEAGADIAQQFGSWIAEQFGKIDWSAIWSGVKSAGTAIVDGLKAGVNLTEQLGAWIGDEWSKIDWTAIGKKSIGLVEGIGSVLDSGKETIGSKVSGWFSGLDAGPAKSLLEDLGNTFNKLLPGKQVLDDIGKSFDGLMKSAQPFLASLDNLGASFALFLPKLEPVAAILGGALLLAIDAVGKVMDALGINADSLGKVFLILLEPIKTILAVLGDLINFVADIFAGRWGKALGDIGSIFTDTFNGLVSTAQRILDLIGGIMLHFADVITKPFRDALTALGGAEIGILGDIKNAVTGAFGAVTGWFEGAWKDTTGVITAPVKLALDLFGGKDNGILGDIFGHITGAFHDIWSWFDSNWGKVSDIITAPFTWLNDHLGGIISPIAHLIFAPFGMIIDGMKAFISGVGNAVNWVLDKLQLSKWSIDVSWPAIPPGLAKGTENWRGGMAWVGELGPEIAVLPQGAAVLPHDESMALVKQGKIAPPGTLLTDADGKQRSAVGTPRRGIDIPGFLFGLDPGNVLDTLKSGWNTIQSFAKEWLGKGASALVDSAFKQFGADLSLGGAFKDVGSAVLKLVKDGVVKNVQELLGLVQKAQPVAVATGGGPVASGIIGWANAHAGALGIDARHLATLLVAISDYENNLQSSGDGPFQLSGGTKDSAVAGGYNPADAASSLDYLLSIGRVQQAVAAFRDGGMTSDSAHAGYLAQERPDAGVDAARTARGDWGAAWALASSIVGGPGSQLGSGGPWAPPLGSYRITQSFGPADASVVGLEPGGFHQGIDLASFMGDVVHAVHDGVVHAAGMGAKSPGLGIAAVVDHANGIMSILGHMMDVVVTAGQLVSVGDPVGHEDSTGSVYPPGPEGAHVHLQLEKDGVPFNPAQLVPLAGGGFIDEEIRGIGVASGKQYRIGELGREGIVPLSGGNPTDLVAQSGNTGGYTSIVGALTGLTRGYTSIVDVLTGLTRGATQTAPAVDTSGYTSIVGALAGLTRGATQTAPAVDAGALLSVVQAIKGDTGNILAKLSEMHTTLTQTATSAGTTATAVTAVANANAAQADAAQTTADNTAGVLSELNDVKVIAGGVGNTVSTIGELTTKHLGEATKTRTATEGVLTLGRGHLTVSQGVLDNVILQTSDSQDIVNYTGQTATNTGEGAGWAKIAVTVGSGVLDTLYTIVPQIAALNVQTQYMASDQHIAAGELTKSTPLQGQTADNTKSTADNTKATANSLGTAGTYSAPSGGGGGAGGAGGTPAGGPQAIMGISTAGQSIPLFTPSNAPGMGGSYNPYWIYATSPVAPPPSGTPFRPTHEMGMQSVEMPAGAARGQTLSFGDVTVTIPASDLQEMQSVQDFFNRIAQEARARGK